MTCRTDAAEAVAQILADLAAGQREVQASNRTLFAVGRGVGLTASRVTTGLRLLREAGAIEKFREGCPGSPTVWRLNTL